MNMTYMKRCPTHFITVPPNLMQDHFPIYNLKPLYDMI